MHRGAVTMVEALEKRKSARHAGSGSPTASGVVFVVPLYTLGTREEDKCADTDTDHPTPAQNIRSKRHSNSNARL
ncbi:hypothetical protein PROFUN_11671 [Planoprotostelium fungivorum]|uniref:Uncharacterized protein n=1 Tax=Planoprotostelium fungivorum TaxID=1890364 RepID=A0A2P6N588_9EUKA|nr:hypothetical protein PROFUN_11671 [Planoprotostelium fungivorum]